MDKNCNNCKNINKGYKYCSKFIEGYYTYSCVKCRRTIAVYDDTQLEKVCCEKYSPKENNQSE